jgi:hypothetical protein
MTKNTKPISTMALPQYALSNDFMERFLDAIHTPGKEIVRSPNTKGIKLVDGSELDGDALTYFTENKCALEEEFLADLTCEIGAKKAGEFCDVIASNWYNGRAKREAIPVQRLKASIRSYLDCILRGRILLSEIVVMHDPLAVTPSLSDADVAKILGVNDRLLLKHISCWLDQHPNSVMLSKGDVFFRRGLSMSQPFTDGDIYREWDFINSYSIAISAPEKFAQMQIGCIPALVNADCDYFNGRVLFFSPFVPKMPAGQLEVGVIPNDRKDTLCYQGVHGGVHEYLLGQHPTK